MHRITLILSSVVTASLALPAQSGWTAPQLLTSINTTASDTAPHLWVDDLTLHFASFASGNWEIWSTTRPARDLPFGQPVLESALGSSGTDSNPFLTADGLEIYFETTRTGRLGGFDLMRATRPSLGAPWNTPSFVTELNTTASEFAASLTADGLEIYFLTTGWGVPYAPNNSVVVATRADTNSPFGAPVLVQELFATQGTSDTHRDVHVSPDGLSIWCTRYESAARRINVQFATRPDRQSPWSVPQVLTEFANVGTLQGVYSFSVSADGSEAILAAGFATSAGSQELMSSTFQGLTKTGIASIGSVANLTYVDPGSAGQPYALSLSLGNTGFSLGGRSVPVDADWLFGLMLGVDFAPFTSGFAGTLDLQGRAVGSVSSLSTALAGTTMYGVGFTLDASAPFNVRTISNAVPIEFR
ncbi:MAG: hypothetical protein ACO4CT_15540 [Planctomycetota bacterium]|jgi:hypothetical protein